MTTIEILRECFPSLPVPEEMMKDLLGFRNAEILEHRENGETVGFALLGGSDLRMLCVRPAWQGRGIGAALLARAEEAARAGGRTRMHIGGYSSGLFIGAPEPSLGFFTAHGYKANDFCEEMSGDMRAFSSANYSLPVPDGCEFGWFSGDWDELLAAVADVDEDWVKYYKRGSAVFCGRWQGRVASFCLVDYEMDCMVSDGKNRVGAVGCVGTVHAARRRGIGLKNVALACDELHRHGCDLCYIHYTGVAHWYAKLGFQTVLKQYFCEKKL